MFKAKKESKIVEQEIKIVEKAPKIVQPLQIEKINKCRCNVVLAIVKAEKKKCIYNFLSTHCTNREVESNLYQLLDIIKKSVHEYEEIQIQHLMQYFIYKSSQGLILESDLIIDTMYDFCKSVQDDLTSSVTIKGEDVVRQD